MIEIVNSIFYYLNLAALLHSQNHTSYWTNELSNSSEKGGVGNQHPLLHVQQIPPGPILPGVVVKFICSVDTDCSSPDKVSYQWEMYQYVEDGNGKGNASVMKLPGHDAEMKIAFNKSIADSKTHCDLVCTVPSNPKLVSAPIKLQFQDNGKPELHPPSGFTVLGITSKTVYFSWRGLPNANNSLKITGYVIEYKNGKGISDWRNGKVSRHEVHGGSTIAACISDLKPWSAYHFRILSRSNDILSPPSLPISILTMEDLPSAAPSDVKVKSVENNLLQVSWKPPPRSTWNGSLLGYNVGFKKASSSEDEPYVIHMFHLMEVLGDPYFYQITVPDSSTKYNVVVRAFNNIGSGPFSDPVIAIPHNTREK